MTQIDPSHRAGFDPPAAAESLAKSGNPLWLKRLFYLTCLFCGYLLSVEALTWALETTDLTDGLLRLIPYCGFAIAFIYYARIFSKLNARNVLMSIFLAAAFMIFLLDVTKHLDSFRGIPVLGSGRAGHMELKSICEIVALCSFFVGIYVSWVETLQSGEALKRSEERLRLIADHIDSVFWVADVELSQMKLVSPAYERIWGRTAESLYRSPRSFLEAIHPEDRPQVISRLRVERGEKQRGFELEYRIQRPDGSIRWIRDRGFPVENSEGRITDLVGIADDITDHKMADEALRQKQQRHEAVLNSAIDGYVCTDSEARLLEVNESYCRMTGYSREELLSTRISDLEAVGTPEESVGHVKRIIQQGYDRFETKHRRKDGTIFDVEVSTRCPDKAWGLQFSFVRDITERKQMEEALRASEERFRATFNVSSVGKVQADPATGRFLQVNEAYCRITGFTEAELLTRTVADLSPPEDREKDWASYCRMVSGQESGYETEKRYIRRDGRVIWVRVHANLIRDEAGQPSCAVAVIEDITEREAFRAELERLVVERTAKLQEMVEELEHFSYSITHDLKAPLRAMRSFAEIASKECGDDVRKEGKEALGRISTSAERMESLITDALNYSRSLRQELPLTDVDTGALLRGMLESYPELQPSRACVQVEGELPLVAGNKAGLTQCFSNLLGNAVKFAKPGERPQIRVWAEEWDGGVRIWVEDKGIGISKEMLPRVFDMFSRGDKSYEGTGIGLALVRKVTQRMGGGAGVESEEGKGSRFWIELKPGEMRAKPGRVEVAPAELKVGTVLYVEDEESDAMFMQRAFAEDGLESALRVVGNGRAAIEYLSGAGRYADRKEYPLPALVLLDLNLPQVSGFAVLKWMRNQPEFARTPVVLFSSSTREDDRAKAVELGANEFVVKPSSGLKFGEVVERLRERWMGSAAG